MKLGLLTTSFPRHEHDVPGQFVLGFARALVSQGAHVEVLAPEPGDARYTEPPRFPGMTVRWVRYLRPRALEQTFYGAGVLDNLRAHPSSALGLLPFVVALAAQARRHAPAWDAVVSHWALPSALVAGALGRRHLAVLHSADVFLLERLPGRGVLARSIAQGADELLFSSRDLRGRFLRLLSPVLRAEVASRCHVCAMGITPSEAPASRTPHADMLRVVSMGRLIELKGLAHAIEAVARLEQAELLVAGDGPARAQLEQQAQRLGARVRFLGELHGADKAALWAQGDVFVLPSLVLPSGRSEGMPTTVLEAMEHGLPVIASDVGGLRDVVQPNGNGSLVPPGDTAALSQALNALRDPEHKAMLARGARETAAMYHWSRLAPHLYELATGTQVVADQASC